MVAAITPGLNGRKDINRPSQKPKHCLRVPGPGPGHVSSSPTIPVSTHPLPLDRVSKQLDHILAFYSTAPKTFGPGNEGALGAEKLGHSSNGLLRAAAPPPTLPHLVQARLVTWEGEVEPKLQALTAHRDLIQEFGQAMSSEVKELWGTCGAQLCPRSPSQGWYWEP